MASKTTKILLATLALLLLLSLAVTSLVVFILLPARDDTPPLTFADLRESDIPGRYKMTDGGKVMFIVLYDDHTFMNEDGTTYAQYRWDITPEGFSITWQKSGSLFTNLESATIYTTARSSGVPVRLEKLPPYTPEQRALPAPIASIQFGTLCETNGLLPVNTAADGEILPARVADTACYRLVRKPNKNDAYLYLQIAPGLKDPPFTNALLLVEYFDRASTFHPSARLMIHYDDDRGGPYMASQPLRMAGSDTWQEATFYLPTPVFQNQQNDGADLRLAVNRSELPIRSVKLLKNAPLPETKMPFASPR